MGGRRTVSGWLEDGSDRLLACGMTGRWPGTAPKSTSLRAPRSAACLEDLLPAPPTQSRADRRPQTHTVTSAGCQTAHSADSAMWTAVVGFGTRDAKVRRD